MDENRHLEPKKAAMIEALIDCKGVVTDAVKAADIARATHYLWMKEDADYRVAVEDVNEVTLDFAERKLHALVEKGDVAATLFLLKTKGKKRGYIEKQEIEHSGQVAITWNEQKTYETKSDPIETK